MWFERSFQLSPTALGASTIVAGVAELIADLFVAFVSDRIGLLLSVVISSVTLSTIRSFLFRCSNFSYLSCRDRICRRNEPLWRPRLSLCHCLELGDHMGRSARCRRPRNRSERECARLSFLLRFSDDNGGSQHSPFH